MPRPLHGAFRLFQALLLKVHFSRRVGESRLLVGVRHLLFDLAPSVLIIGVPEGDVRIKGGLF
jgi:hypothetical protein